MTKEFQITIESEIFKPSGIDLIMARRKAIYVCETCIAPSGNWLNYPVAVFYQPDVSLVPEGGSQYFGMYFKALDLALPPIGYICNAISATKKPIVGVVADNGEIIYSRYRHDMRFSSDKSVWIDGGRDYTRYNGSATLVDLSIHEGVLEVSRF